MQPRENLQRHDSSPNYLLDSTLPVPETTTLTTHSNPINRLAGVLVGMNNRSSAQTLMVRPAGTTTLTFDVELEQCELFENLSNTKIICNWN